MSEDFELIRCEDKLRSFSYPVDNTTEQGRKGGFFLGNKDFWHNGMHFLTTDPIKAIADGEIIAYRVSESYKSKDFDIEKIEIPEILVSHAMANPYLRFLFESCFTLINGVYKLKNDPTDKDKEQALHSLGKLYSDSFVLMKHSLKNSDKKEMEFFSLYNHLTPSKNIALKEKINLFYYETTIKLKNISPYNTVDVLVINKNADSTINSIAVETIPSETTYEAVKEEDYIVVRRKLNEEKKYYSIVCKSFYENCQKHSGVKASISHIPCEAATKYDDDCCLIKWTMNGTEKTGIIKKDSIRQDEFKETKRKLLYFEEKNNKENYLPADYAQSEANKIAIYNNKNRGKRNVMAVVDKDTEFTVRNTKDLIGYLSMAPDMTMFNTGIEISYNDGGAEKTGFVFLDFNHHMESNGTDMAAVKSFGEEAKKKLQTLGSSESIDIGGFLEITCKVEKDKIVQPKNKEIQKDTIIGYSGYCCDCKDENENEKIETIPRPIHFETFVETDKLQFMDFEKQDGVLYPAYCKVKEAVELHGGELKAETKQKDISSLLQRLYPNDSDAQNSDAVSDVCLEVIATGGLAEGEVFYEVKIIGKIIPFDLEEYVLRCDIEWNEEGDVYFTTEEKTVRLHRFNPEATEPGESPERTSRIVPTGKEIKLHPDFFYLESTRFSDQEDKLNTRHSTWEQLGIVSIPNPGELNLSPDEKAKRLRRPEFYYEKTCSDEAFYVSASTLSQFTQRTHKNKTHIYIFRENKLPKTEILEKPEGTIWTEGPMTVSSGCYVYNYTTIKEYPSFDDNNSVKTEWRQIEEGGKKYYCDDKLIEHSTSAANIELVYYDEWRRFFKEIELAGFGRYRCKKANRPKLFDALGIAGDAEKAVCESLTDDDLTYNLYFENETEWKRDDGKMEELRKIAARSQTELQSEAKDFDIFKDISRLFNRRATRFVYFQPCAFLNHLDKVVTPPEFNPYAGKRYKDIYKDNKIPKICGNNITETGDSVVKDNPGFAPVFKKGSWGDSNPNNDGFSCVTGFFNEDYINVKRGNGKTYKENGYSIFTHEGVDFRGEEGTEIKSFIYGKVLAYGEINFYGRAVFIANKDSSGIFLLGHLKDYNKTVLDSGQVSPGDVVGYVGTSGPDDGNGNIDGKYAAHLHVTYFQVENSDDVKNDVVEKENKAVLAIWEKYSTFRRMNPFDHSSEKKPNA